MIVGIMQPYFFPYLGYFQLMAAVDHFVIYDDAQYMKGGWINRNRLLHEGTPHWWTRAIRRDDFRLPIMDRYYEDEGNAGFLMDRIRHYYRKAPYFSPVSSFIECLMATTEANVARFNETSLKAIAAHLGIRCSFSRASDLGLSQSSGEEKVIRICERLAATRYVNASGGRSLYSSARFGSEGIELRFLQPQLQPYPQPEGTFVPGLSIVDVLMYNDAATVRQMLGSYALEEGDT